MTKRIEAETVKVITSLLLVEGDTDEIFFKRVKDTYLDRSRVKIYNLEGLYNINQKIIDKIENYTQKNEGEFIRVYCCLDRESRYGQVPGFNQGVLLKYVKEHDIKNIMSSSSIIATQQIESWFFYDIEGIYAFLRVPVSERNPKAYKPPEKFGYKDLQRLFERNGRTYNKGKKSGNFINKLDIKKIVSNCRELQNGIELIKANASDSANRIFGR